MSEWDDIVNPADLTKSQIFIKINDTANETIDKINDDETLSEFDNFVVDNRFALAKMN